MTDALDKARQAIEAMTSAERRLEIVRLIEATKDMPGVSVRLAKLMRTEWPAVVNELIRAEKRHDVMCDLAGAVRENQLSEQDELDAAKQRIAELEAERDAMGNALAALVKDKDEAHRTGFLAAQKMAVECVPTNWLDPAVQHMLGGKTITGPDVEKAMQAVLFAISQLKPEGE